MQGVLVASVLACSPDDKAGLKAMRQQDMLNSIICRLFEIKALVLPRQSKLLHAMS